MQETFEESPSRRAVREMTAAGMTVRQIALALGISTQRVHQHLRKLEEARLRALRATETPGENEVAS